VTTRQLSLNFLSERRNFRHDLMRQMVAERFTNQQIADELNRQGIKTPSGKNYYAELVGATWSKLRKRDLRKSSNTIKFIEMGLYKVEDDGEI
jgi:hypothetical protein